MDFLEILKQDPKCLYLYNWGPFIYNLQKNCDEYLAIVSDNWSVPEDWVGDITLKEKISYTLNKDGITYWLFFISYWFELVLRGNIMCWECACMNKKYILKEHVKLMMHTDPIQLRKTIDLQRERILYNLNANIPCHDLIWKWITNCKFVNQILDNHKIVNFKEANSTYKELFDNLWDSDVLLKYVLEQEDYQELCKKTDEQLKQSKIKKILQKQNK